MNYGFLIFGELDRRRLAAALAGMLSLPVDAVDIGDEGDDDRNWAAPISCTVTPVTGELHWSLDIYVSNTVPSPPPAPIAAAWVAAQLRTVVAYESVPSPPSAYWLVGPDGRRTRARIYDEGSDDVASYRIDAVEHPLAALPDLPVAALPEIIHSYRMRTPITDRLREELQPWLAGDDVKTAMEWLGAWEAMVTRLTEGWPPDGWYPAEYFRQDLENRDDLARAAEALPPAVREPFDRALGEVDRRFADATEENAGQSTAAGTGVAPPAERWWWRRVPDPLPWRDAPGQ